MNREAVIDFLLDTSSYPHGPDKVRHLQTHASDVFIAAPYVYKVKKPVDLGFLDFSTLEKRKLNLERELVLNRRLTDGIYLKVLEISLKNGEYTLGPGDKTVEYALKMKELSEECFLKNLLEQGRVSEKDFDRIAEKLAAFYKSGQPEDGISAFGSPQRIKPDVYDNITGSREYAGKTVTENALGAITFYNDLFFSRKSDLLKKRAREGHIKDCHGDLHLEHINISPEGINIYDCIEFNERFRFIDTASDTAFLAMDLDFNGYEEYSRYFISRVSKLTDDGGMYGVLDFYKCYRALVRGKVLSIKSQEPEVPERSRQECVELAERYYKLALRYALLGSRTSLIVVFGSIGTGKSRLSKALSDELSCPLLSSDVLRKQASGIEPLERRYESYEGGLYSKEITERVYNELIERAIETVKPGGSAVIDASFAKRKWRDLVSCTALKHGVSVQFVQTDAPTQTVRERLRRRELKGESVSDGRPQILERFVADFEEPERLCEQGIIKMDTTREKDSVLRELLEKLIMKNIETDYEFR